MITGVETAGLVLAIIPLLISALEHYNETKSVLAKFFHKSLYIKRLIEGLDEQRVLIENELNTILRKIGHKDDNLTLTIDNYKHLLAQEEVVDDLRYTLGQSYGPYVKALDRCANAILEIARRIKGLMKDVDFGLEDLATIAETIPRKNGRYEFRNRLKISLNVDDLEGRLKELDDCTTKMTRLRISGLEVNDDQSNPDYGTSGRFVSFIGQVQKHAIRLHGAIRRGWQPGCHPSHMAHLLLDQRSATMRGKREKLKFRVQFGMSMPSLQDLPDPWEQVDVEVQNLNDSQQTLKATPSASLGNGSGVRVAFAVTLTGQPNTLSHQAVNTKSTVGDLCCLLERINRTGRYVQLLLTPDGQLLSLEGERTTTQRAVRAADMRNFVSLEDVLQEFPNVSRNDRPRWWDLGQRMRLATKVASSVTQLSYTPWLASNWSKRDIHFYRSSSLANTSPLRLPFAADQVFLRQVFSNATTIASETALEAPKVLLELGIVLLEIWCGEVFESYTAREALVIDDTYESRNSGALRWLNDTAHEIQPLYLRAVHYCVETRHPSTWPLLDWEDTSFRKLVCDMVVRPLWQNSGMV